VVHGEDGLDEISTTSRTYASELKDGNIKDYTINPEDFDIKVSSMDDIAGGTAFENAKSIVEILKGGKGPKRDIVLLNSGAALYIGKASGSIAEGIDMAGEIIDSKKAYEKLQELVNYRIL
ncbi:MAG TPA: anthranilate phosphoribosyltransferase, partial [Clostridium sp.]|nr:anthranilate phosphoribosyltransferase [Clostridium sp.]